MMLSFHGDLVYEAGRGAGPGGSGASFVVEMVSAEAER
jgi:hypothetical protein